MKPAPTVSPLFTADVAARPQQHASSFARTVALHSLGWLVAANTVGVWMAVCLVWPSVGNLLAPLTFGRWAPLHLNWQLYGWCSVPVVGMLLVWCLDDSRENALRDAHIALASWSAALVVGGGSWLAGTVTGKLFLDWHSWARFLLPAAMVVLWTILVLHTRASWRRLPRGAALLRACVLGMLAFVPPILFWSTSRGMYQPVNPDSGGATGAAILGSTLGIVTVFMLAPLCLGVHAPRNRRPFVAALGASWLVFAALDRGSVSHHSITQIVSLATLLLWIPLLPWYWSRYAWPSGAKPWLLAAAVWWTILVVTGWLSFLPGISEAFKFTHALVGHAHLAMAGLITSVNATLLTVITRRAPPRPAFWLWQAGCAVYIGSMLALGYGETLHQADLFRGESWVQGLLGLRLAAGAAMLAGSVRWLASFVRQ